MKFNIFNIPFINNNKILFLNYLVFNHIIQKTFKLKVIYNF